MAVEPTCAPGIPSELQCPLTQFAMANASVSIIWIGKDARIYYANSYACTSLGYSRKESHRAFRSDMDPNFPVERWNGHWQELKHDKTRLLRPGTNARTAY